jgi:hypothetical protein
LKAAVVKRIEALEAMLKPSEPEIPPLDFDLLTECEKEYFSLWMRVLRLKARELGYGDKDNKVSWFDLRGCDPANDEDVRAECLAALNAKESKVIETFHAVIEKGVRLTAALSEEEKADVRRYNDVVLFFQNSSIRNSDPNRYTAEDLLRARRRYEEIMVKHGEVVYEKPVGAETD